MRRRHDDWADFRVGAGHAFGTGAWRGRPAPQQQLRRRLEAPSRRAQQPLQASRVCHRRPASHEGSDGAGGAAHHITRGGRQAREQPPQPPTIRQLQRRRQRLLHARRRTRWAPGVEAHTGDEGKNVEGQVGKRLGEKWGRRVGCAFLRSNAQLYISSSHPAIGVLLQLMLSSVCSVLTYSLAPLRVWLNA